MWTTGSLAPLVVLFGFAPVQAQTTVGWPETIDLLAQERSRAETCADLLKASDDKGKK